MSLNCVRPYHIVSHANDNNALTAWKLTLNRSLCVPNVRFINHPPALLAIHFSRDPTTVWCIRNGLTETGYPWVRTTFCSPPQGPRLASELRLVCDSCRCARGVPIPRPGVHLRRSELSNQIVCREPDTNHSCRYRRVSEMPNASTAPHRGREGVVWAYR